MKNKILFISDFSSINGGAAKVAILDAIALAKDGNEVIFFAGDNVTPEIGLKEAGIKVIQVGNKQLIDYGKLEGFFKGFYSKKTKKMLKKVLDENGDDMIIHIHSWTKTLTYAIFKALKGRKNKIFITTHDYFLICPNGGLFDYRKNEPCQQKNCQHKGKCLKVNCDKSSYIIKLWRWLRYKKQLKAIKKINFKMLTLNGDMQGNFKNYTDNEFLIPLNFSKNSRPLKKELCKEKPEYFMYVGRFSPEKGLLYFLEAAKKANCQCKIVGSGEDFEEIKNKYQDDKIEFVGWKTQEEINELYKKCYALVLPSGCFEGDPLALYESFSNGIPVLIRNTTNGSENIVDGKNGYKFASMDDLVQQLKKIPSMNYLELRQNTLGLYSNYSIEDKIRDLEKIYNS